MLLACNIDGSDERAIEKFNTKRMAVLQMGEVTSVDVKGFSGDGVQMWTVSPPGYSADTKKKTTKKWPLMQFIHSGPHTCWSDTWHWR